MHPSQGVYSVFVLHPLHDPQDRIRLIRGRTETSRGQGRFILVYRLAMDAKTRKGDGVAD